MRKYAMTIRAILSLFLHAHGMLLAQSFSSLGEWIPLQPDSPVCFLPGLVSTELPEFASAMSPDGRRFWFNRMSADRSKMYLLETRLENGRWTPPVAPTFADTTVWQIDPFVSKNGRYLFFSTKISQASNQKENFDLWQQDLKTGKSRPLPFPPNSPDDDIYCSIAQDRILYFARFLGNKSKILASRMKGNVYHPAKQLAIPGTDTASILNPSVSPDGKHLIFTSRQLGGYGSGDLFITQLLKNKQWSYPQNLGPRINSAYADFAALFSPDGKTLFFTSERPGIVQDYPRDKRRPGDLYATTFDVQRYPAILAAYETWQIHVEKGLTVYAYHFPVHARKEPAKNLILLFHQGNSNGLAEYQNIIPVLHQKGYPLLVVDLRIGAGLAHGGRNLTAEEWENPVADAYCAALADMESSLLYAIEKGYSGKKLLLGSGYSAALALKLAEKYPEEMAGVLAFAPAQGGALSPCEPTENLLSALKIPLIAFRANAEMKQAGRAEQRALFQNRNIPYLVLRSKQHGASVLDPGRNKKSHKAAWKRVNRFLSDLNQK